MNLNKNSNMPLYMQFKDILIKKIRSGELKPGSILPTEKELCMEYGISRYPVRQAMEELVGEGYLKRTRGKGTFVKSDLSSLSSCSNKTIGIIMNNLTKGFNGDILTGFERQARKKGYLAFACSSEDCLEQENICLDRLTESKVRGIVLFPVDNSQIHARIDQLKSMGIYLGLIDRNSGIFDLDYVGSDNSGGAYSAVRHMGMQGFRNVVFVSDSSDVSSVRERYDGYIKAVNDFGLNAISRIDINVDLGKTQLFRNMIKIDQLKDKIIDLKEQLPIGIFASNDFVALQCMKLINEEGMIIGKDIGIVGFDNIAEGEYAPIPLTTVSQNGLLLGQTAADIAINKIEGITNQVHKAIIPTQLIIRDSCGERL